MRYRLTSPAREAECHLYIPADQTVHTILVNGQEIPFRITKTGESVYADFTAIPDGVLDIEVLFV